MGLRGERACNQGDKLYRHEVDKKRHVPRAILVYLVAIVAPDLILLVGPRNSTCALQSKVNGPHAEQ